MDQLRVLWFTNTSGNSEVIKDNNRGGWISSLEKSIIRYTDIKLGIAFLSDNQYFEQNDNITYYGIKLKYNSKVKRLYQRYLNKMQDDTSIDNLLMTVSDFKPDIIHILGTESLFGLIIKHVKVPVVISIQGNITMCTKMFFRGIPKSNFIFNSSIRDFLLKADYLTQYKSFVNKSIREQEILKSAKYIIGRTDWDRRLTSVFAPEAKYFYGGEILRDSFYKSEWKKLNLSKRFEIISIVSTGAYKGLETIFNTSKILTERKIEFKWTVAGISESDSIVKIVKASTQINFSNYNINIVGSLDEHRLINSLIESNLYVSTSHIENSPNNVCEAMIIGMPVVATFAGGTGSLIDNNVDGILIQDGDQYALAGAIIDLYKNSSKAIFLGDNAKERALKRHNAETISQVLKETYLRILKDQNA